MRALVVQTVAQLACAAALSAQVPAGAEFRINSYTTGSQATFLGPNVRATPDGGFIAVWHGDGPSGEGVWVRRLDAAGTAIGSEIEASASLPSGSHAQSTLAVDGRGDFVVAWVYRPGGPGDEDILARRFDRNGIAQGAAFLVNTYTTSWQTAPNVAADDAGNFVVAWDSNLQDGSSRGVFAQRFAASGAPLGAEFQVNTYTPSYQMAPSIARAPTGDFVIVWRSLYQDGSSEGVFGQRYAADGAPRGGEFLVNTDTSSLQTMPRVAADATGNFVVSWTDYADGGRLGVMARRYDAAGAPQGPEFRVNSYTTENQWVSSVDLDETGNFVVTWASDGQDGSMGGIYAQRFDALGQRRGGEFRVNTQTAPDQLFTSVASDKVGNFSVVWSSIHQDGNGFGVFAQRFGGVVPATIAVDTVADADSDGNGVLEPGEAADLRPAWRNVNGAAQAIEGAIGDVAGPGGPAILDATGDYGSIPNGATAPCLDCYEVSVTDPAPRPATHWDIAVTETLAPDVQGQTKIWTLHVGDSFTDVPRTSGFYRFVETLLHHGVTGGCSATGYCPASSTTRGQMAVFLLVALEGTGFAPAACTTPVFADVPASSPFCRWIEEIARRGVAGGCGSGNYCPSSPVTREQMAVLVLRTADPTLAPPACVIPVYSDVPASSTFCRWIEELTRRGIVTGCGGGNYCPASELTREQVAVFISATFGLTLYGP